MKRIHPVGKSRDNRKLYLAHQQGAKFGSMELSIGPKLRALLRSAEAERLAKRGKRLPEEELEEVRRASRAAETRAKQAGARAHTAWRRQKEAEDRAREADRKAREAEERAAQAERRARAAERGAMAAAARGQEVVDPVPGGDEDGLEGIGAVIRVPQAPPDEADPPASESVGAPEVPAVPDEPGRPQGLQEVEQAPAPRERVDLAPDSTLTPAEIQALLRAGRGIRSVAKQAEAPIDWVRRLAAPIEAERLGVVTQLLRSFVVRPRLGRSALPVGAAIVENLRDKGVRFPERIAEVGWTAWRPDGRQWRVRFVYESRGRRQRADWLFDPQTREVTPQNTLAQELGFRAPREGDGRARQTGEANAAAIRPRRISGSRSSTGSARKAAGTKRSTGKSRSTRKRASSAKGSSGAKRSRSSTATRRSRKRAPRRSGGSRR